MRKINQDIQRAINRVFASLVLISFLLTITGVVVGISLKLPLTLIVSAVLGSALTIAAIIDWSVWRKKYSVSTESAEAEPGAEQ